MAPEEMFSDGVYEDEGNSSATGFTCRPLTPEQQEAKMRAESSCVARTQSNHRARSYGVAPVSPSPSTRQQQPIPPAACRTSQPHIRKERRCAIYLTERPQRANGLLLALLDIAGIKSKEGWAIFHSRDTYLIRHNIFEHDALAFQQRFAAVGAKTSIRPI